MHFFQWKSRQHCDPENKVEEEEEPGEGDPGGGLHPEGERVADGAGVVLLLGLPL